MEFVSRKKCIEYYESQYPELPRYMIEMALDYDLAQGEGSSSNEKPMTNKEKRKAKRLAKQREPVKREVNVFKLFSLGHLIQIESDSFIWILDLG